jgi:hypothetical protein
MKKNIPFVLKINSFRTLQKMTIPNLPKYSFVHSNLSTRARVRQKKKEFFHDRQIIDARVQDQAMFIKFNGYFIQLLLIYTVNNTGLIK